MSEPLSPDDTDKLLELQQQCDACKEAIVQETHIDQRTEMQSVCERCKKVRLRVPELMALKQRMKAFN
ncbi:MAG: hypothetical protein ACQETD_06670, partial [Pseudomonadota bacterium]